MRVNYHYEYTDAYHINDFVQAGEGDYYKEKTPDAFEIEAGIILPYRRATEATAVGGEYWMQISGL